MREPQLPFVAPLRGWVIRAVYRLGFNQSFIDTTLSKWEAGYTITETRCTEESKGKEYGLESECKCWGCSERRCFTFFDQVRKNFGTGILIQEATNEREHS